MTTFNMRKVIFFFRYLQKDNEKTIIEGLKKVENPYRFQYFEDKNLIVDASHNPNGIKALRDNLDYYYPNEKRRFIFVRTNLAINRISIPCITTS